MHKLSDEQGIVFEQVVANVDRQQSQTIGGLAGTGKTVLIYHLFNHFSERGRQVYVCAPTGKAADVLQMKGVPATTIHKLFYTLVETATKTEVIQAQDGSKHEVEVIDQSEGGMRFRLNAKIDKEVGTGAPIVIVDESSMVTKKQAEEILSYGIPVIWVGDHGQLPPVSGHGIMEDPDFKLETIHRNAGEIAHFAAHLRSGGAPRSFGGGGKKVRFVGPCWKEFALDVRQVLCGKNLTRCAVNKFIRDERGYDGVLVEGERLISLRNGNGLRNGSLLKVVRVVGKHIVADKGGSQGRYEYHPLTLGQHKQFQVEEGGPHPFEYGYCLTAHKAQGSEWDTVMVIDEGTVFQWGKGSKDTVRRWRYTAATRAVDKLLWC